MKNYHLFVKYVNSFNGISKYQIEINDIERLEEILSDRKKQKSVKAKELIQIFECGPCEDKTDEKTCKAIVSNLSKWLTGLKGNINSIFDMQFEEIDTSSFHLQSLNMKIQLVQLWKKNIQIMQM